MAAETNTGMDRADLKRLLTKSKQEPVNCAMAQPKDPPLALLLLHKVKQPRAVAQDLEKQFPDARNPRWGTAHVDLDEDPKLVQFRINKPVSGMARRLVKTLKGTTFTKVVILLEDGTPVESDAEEEEAEAAPPAGPAAPAQAQAPVEDAGALAQTLKTLAGRIAGTAGNDPARRAELLGLAQQANVALKAGDTGAAAVAVGALRNALGGDAAPSPSPSPSQSPTPPPDGDALRKLLANLTLLIPRLLQDEAQRPRWVGWSEQGIAALDAGDLATAARVAELLKADMTAAKAAQDARAKEPTGPVAYAKARLEWLAARRKMEEGIDALGQAIAEACEDEPDAAAIEQSYRDRVRPILATLDEELADRLDAARGATDPEARARFVRQAQAAITRYQTFVEGERLIADLDDNPFGVSPGIAGTIGATLKALAATVR